MVLSSELIQKIEDERAFIGNVLEPKFYDHKGSARRDLSGHV